MPAVATAEAPVLRPTGLRALHCSGCARVLVRYSTLGPNAVITVRCRDCKRETMLRGADVVSLLGALSQGRE